MAGIGKGVGVMADQICHDCGAVYDGAGQGRYCPTCRKERLKAVAKERDLSSIGRKAYAKQLEMRKATIKTESCGNCAHWGKDSHFCRNTDSKCWGDKVADSGWCSRWEKEEADGKA